MSLRGRQAVTRSLAPSVRFLIVSVGGTQLALYADRIQGLLTIDEAGSASELTVQNVIYPHVDVAGRLHRLHDPEGPDTRVVLYSNGNVRGNLRVAMVHGLKEVEQSHILPLPSLFRGEEQRWFQGLILFEETVALIPNPTWILEGSARVLQEGPVLIGRQAESC